MNYQTAPINKKEIIFSAPNSCFNKRKIKESLAIAKNSARGFTLVELLLVIGIIATLAVVTYVALDPAQRFQDARDARRVSDVETILSAVHQYVIDNRGSFPSSVDETEKQLGTASSGCEATYGECSANTAYCLDLSSDLARYLKTLPFDPQTGTAESTQYTIVKDSNGIVTVKACNTEGETGISVSR